MQIDDFAESAVRDMSVLCAARCAEMAEARFDLTDAVSLPPYALAFIAAAIFKAALVLDAVVIVRALVLTLIIIAVKSAVYFNQAE